MIYGGDIVEGDRDDGDMGIFINLLKLIKPKYGVFSVLGNHEHYGGQDKGNFFEKSGMMLLSDSVLAVDRAFALGGRNDSHFRSRKSIRRSFKELY